MTTTASVPSRGLSARCASLRACLDAVPLSWPLLLMRLALGAMFLNAGLVKYQSWEVTLLLFRDEYKVPLAPPELMAGMATFNEIAVSSLLILGLGTRVATLPFFGMLATIQLFVYPEAWRDHLLWASILVTLLARGAGAVSLDHWISRAWAARAVPATVAVIDRTAG